MHFLFYLRWVDIIIINIFYMNCLMNHLSLLFICCLVVYYLYWNIQRLIWQKWLKFCLSRVKIKYSLVKHMSCYLIVNPWLRRTILFLISFLLGITLAHQDRLVTNFHLDLHLLLPLESISTIIEAYVARYLCIHLWRKLAGIQIDE